MAITRWGNQIRRFEWLIKKFCFKITHLEPSVGFQSDNGKVQGHIWVTNYRLRFQQIGNDQQFSENVWEVVLGSISNVKKMGHSKVSRGEDSYGIQIKCKVIF